MGVGALAPQRKPRNRWEPPEEQPVVGSLGKSFRMSEIEAYLPELAQQTSRNEEDRQNPPGGEESSF